VSSWWKNHLDGKEIIVSQEGQYLSNWFKIESLPKTLYIHSLNDRYSKKTDEGFPCFRVRNNLISFASADDLELKHAQTYDVSTMKILQNDCNNNPVENRIIRNAFINILRQTWNKYLSDMNMPVYMMSDEKKCFYFTNEILQGKKRLAFNFSDLISGQRSLVGTFRKKIWHFGLSGNVSLYPELVYAIKTHVLFSEDGMNILDSKNRLHSARRSACKDWWNHHWRDRLMAAMYWIKQNIGEEHLSMPVSSSHDIRVAFEPIIFNSVIDYDDARVGKNPFLDEDEPMDEMELSESDAEVES